FESFAPDFVVVPLRAPSDAARKPLLECRRARGIVYPKTKRHDPDALCIDLITPREVFVGRGGIALRFGDQRQGAKPYTFPVTRPIHEQTRDTPRSKVRNAVKILDLLRHIEAVEEDHCRSRPL